MKISLYGDSINIHQFLKIAIIVCTLFSSLTIGVCVQAKETETLDTEEIIVAENPGARTVPHYTFSGTPGTAGTGANGDVWDGTHYYLSDGTLATECFFCDGVNTYYLQNDGTPMIDRLTYHPDGQHIIYFDYWGHEVFNANKTVFQSITGEEINEEYYFNVYGFMYINELTFLSGSADQPAYFDYAGARVKNGQYILPDGNLVIADKYGTLLHNIFTYDAFGRIVYCNWNGCFAKGLLSDNNFCYSFDESDGHLIQYYPTENCTTEAIPFGNLLSCLNNSSGNDSSCIYEMRLIGDNDITGSITSWYGPETVIDYMEKNVDDQYWRLAIYRDEQGNIVNNVTGKAGSYSTIRGITIGSDKASVRASYGEPLYSGSNGANWDWYNVYWNFGDKYAIGWKESYACVHYGIRFYYDEKGLVNQIVYQKYPILAGYGGYKDNLPIMSDTQDLTPYYARREIIKLELEKGVSVSLNASTSKYAVTGCSYQWYAVKPQLVSAHNADEVEKIAGATDSCFSLDINEYPYGVYCRIITPDGTPYDVFYVQK